MDFKETMFDIAGKVGDFVDKGINKSKDSYNKMAEKNRIKKELTRLNTEVNNILSSVGRRLYNEERSNEKFAAVFGEVEAKEKEIAELKKQLRVLDGTVLCPSCGEDMNKNDTACPKCGAKAESSTVEAEIEVVEAVEVQFCQQCGAKLDSTAKFCNQCGSKVSE